MNYGPGAHKCKPIGKIKYSTQIYYNKHMNFLGLQYLTNKMIKLYDRIELNRKKGLSIHYTNDIKKIKINYNDKLAQSKILP